jgi:Rod binding domain-containing protein
MTPPLSALQALQGTGATAPGKEAVDPKALKAAKDFEAIFLRTLLSSLEKATSVSGGGKLNTSQSTYGSMVVGALADNISGSGGIGLAEVVARSLSVQAAQPSPSSGPKPPK